MDLWVGDGVQQLPLLLTGEDELTQLLPVDLPVLEQDLRPEVVDDAGIGRSVRLHDCCREKAATFGVFYYGIVLNNKTMCQKTDMDTVQIQNGYMDKKILIYFEQTSTNQTLIISRMLFMFSYMQL